MKRDSLRTLNARRWGQRPKETLSPSYRRALRARVDRAQEVP